MTAPGENFLNRIAMICNEAADEDRDPVEAVREALNATEDDVRRWVTLALGDGWDAPQPPIGQ